MRTTDATLDLTLTGKPARTSRIAGMTGVLKTVWRLLRNRNQIGSLQDLDDHQLLDLGLHRSDVHRAMTSPFFDEPGQHLTQAARNRTNAYYRDAAEKPRFF